MLTNIGKIPLANTIIPLRRHATQV